MPAYRQNTLCECALIRHRSSSSLIAWNTIALACARRMGRCFVTRFLLQPLRVQGWQLSLLLRCCLSVRVVKDQSLYPVVLRFAHASAEAVLLGFDAPLGGFAGSLLRCVYRKGCLTVRQGIFDMPCISVRHPL